MISKRNIKWIFLINFPFLLVFFFLESLTKTSNSFNINLFFEIFCLACRHTIVDLLPVYTLRAPWSSRRCNSCSKCISWLLLAIFIWTIKNGFWVNERKICLPFCIESTAFDEFIRLLHVLNASINVHIRLKLIQWTVWIMKKNLFFRKFFSQPTSKIKIHRNVSIIQQMTIE